MDRLGIYEFLADNPFLIFTETGAPRTAILMAGFSPQSLSYQSTAQRFANRRLRLQADVGQLLATGVVQVVVEDRRVGYELTDRGAAATRELRSLYAHGYRESARRVFKRLKGKSDTALERDLREWLRAEPFLLDLLHDDQEPV